jgi:hypothetical protein
MDAASHKKGLKPQGIIENTPERGEDIGMSAYLDY